MIFSRLKLQKLFEPQSIAIVGAAREPNKLGNIIVANIQKSKFKGKIFPVNPNAADVNGLPCYQTYSAIPQTPDLAVIALPADIALRNLPDIALKGTKNVVILSAGFKEIGAEGLERERQLIEIAKKYSLNIIGPNCLGFVNNDCNLNATFGSVANERGNLRFISQSGAIATALFDWAQTSSVGISSCITLGNKTVLGENEVLEYFLHSKTQIKGAAARGLSKYQPVGLYLESIQQGLAFLKYAAAINKTNPVFVLKPGKSVAAQAAMQSHTGAMANDDSVLDAALKSAGILRCDNLEDFFDLAKAFSWENAPENNSIAIVSNAGGPGVLTTDALQVNGLQLADLSKKTKLILEKNLPRAANIHNPIDVLGDALAERYTVALEAVLKEKSVSGVVVILTPQIMTQIEQTAQVIARLSNQYKKPVICSFIGGSVVEIGERVLNFNKIPSYRYPERAVKVLAAMSRWRQWQKNAVRTQNVFKQFSKKTVIALHAILQAEYNAHHTALASETAQDFAKLSGIAIPPSGLVKDIDQALRFAKKIEYPVVLKISSPTALHKTELHAVIPGIKNELALKSSFEAIQKAASTFNDPSAYIEIQKHIAGDAEVLVGFKRDPSFGLILLFGAGGILAELITDRNLAIAPQSDAQIKELILNSKIGRIIHGYRGGSALALKPLIALIQNLLAVGAACPSIKEMEINPVILTKTQAIAVDTKIVSL